MGRTRKIKNGWIRWAIKGKTRKRISQKDEKCTKCSIATWRLQTLVHKEAEGRITWGRTNQKASRGGARAGKTAWAGQKEKSSANSWGFQKSKRRAFKTPSWNSSERGGRSKKNSRARKKARGFGTFEKNKRSGTIPTEVRRTSRHDRSANPRTDESAWSARRNPKQTSGGGRE